MAVEWHLRTASLVTVALSLLLNACGQDTETGSDTESGGTESPAAEAGETSLFSAEFTAYSSDALAVTYDEEAVPVGSWATVTVSPADRSTHFRLDVHEVEPDRDFGAHLHTQPCGPDTEDSGPHYQNETDPEQPSTDPQYANAGNEVWLDLRTDDTGTGTAETGVGWQVRPGEANSIVLHEEHTSTEHDSAGTAGERLSCVDVAL